MNNPINRTTVQVEDNKFKIHTKHSPINYKKPDGSYEEIDLTFQDTTSNIGEISLLSKNIVSVGKRKGNNPHKVVGIRPDINQHLGTQQLEFSLINVELDNEKQDFNVEEDLEIKLNTCKVYQLVKLNKTFNDCKIEFDIHTKGLEIQNVKYENNETIRDYGFNLNNVGEDNGNSMLNTHSNYTKLNKDIPYLDFTIGKINNEFITMGQYTNTEEFGSADLSNYSVNEDLYTHGSAVYYHNSIVFTVCAYNIDNFKDIIINNLCSMYDLKDYDDDGYGKYLTKDNKKVIGYYVKDNVFVGFINTIEIADEIKNLFIRKTFEDTSCLNITLDDFCNDITNKFNKNLTLEIDTNYYQPINDKFQFKISNESFYIRKPIAFDKDYNALKYDTYHTLKDNGDGSYRYTKILNVSSALLPNSAQYMDVNLSTMHSEAYLPLHRSNLAKSASTLLAARNAGSGTGNTSQAGILENSHIRSLGSYAQQITTSNQFGSSTARNVNYLQCHHAFDTSGITSAVTSSKYILNASVTDDKSTTTAINFIVLKSTYDGSDIAGSGGNPPLTTAGLSAERAIFNDFAGFTSGWDADDVTEYSASTSISAGGFASYEFVMNADAKTDIENNGTFSVAAIDYDEFYLNSNDSSWGTFPSTTGNYLYTRAMFVGQPDNSTASARPVLEVTTATVSTPTENATFFGANF